MFVKGIFKLNKHKLSGEILKTKLMNIY